MKYSTSWNCHFQKNLLVLNAGNEGMIHWLTINNHPSNPQQPIHSLLSTSKKLELPFPKKDCLVVSTPLKNIKVNGKDDIPYIMEDKKCLKPPTRRYKPPDFHNLDHVAGDRSACHIEGTGLSDLLSVGPGIC